MKNIENDDDFEIDLNISNKFIIEFVAVSVILTQIEILKFKKKTIDRVKNEHDNAKYRSSQNDYATSF